MNNTDINKKLLEFLPPQMSVEFNEITWWDDGINTNAHSTYGELLVPYLKRQIVIGNNKECERIFEFIHKLFEINHETINNILIVSVLLQFKGFYDISKFFAPHHKKTRKAGEDILKSPY